MPKSAYRMKIPSLLQKLTLVVALCATTSVHALSLGRLRGAAVVGRTLDVSLPVQLDKGEDASALCVDAQVFFGDSSVTTERVRTSTEAGASAGDLLVRIRTTALVDEPVVTIYLREGCSAKTTRKFVLLADPLANPGAEPVAPRAALPAVPSATVVPLAPVSTGTSVVVQPVLPPVSASAVRVAKAARKEKAAVAESPADLPPAPVVDAAKKIAKKRLTTLAPGQFDAKIAANAGAAPRKARLTLEPLDLAAERDPALRASPDLLTAPSADAQQRASAAALWQVLGAAPQDALRDQQRLKALEASVEGLAAQNRKNTEALASVSAQLTQARSERYSNWLVYGLAVVLLVALAAIVALWLRGRSSRRLDRAADGDPWWRKGTDSAAGKLSQRGPASGLMADAEADSIPSHSEDVDVDLGMDESLFDDLKGASAAAPSVAVKPAVHLEPQDSLADFANSMPNTPRLVNAEELFDIQQQADFFITLGQYDQAIEVLLHHISDNVETSALAYLDLFDLYHKVGKTAEYEELRADFNRVFNAQVPAFADYSNQDRGLDSYQSALSRIEALWPTPKVLDLIEESIFRKPGLNSDAFNLTAYRELLLLYSVAKDIVEKPMAAAEFDLDLTAQPSAIHEPSGAPTWSEQISQNAFASTNIQPLSADNFEPDSLPPVSLDSSDSLDFDLTVPPASPRVGVDIDLFALDVAAPGPQPPAADDQVAKDPANAHLLEWDLDIDFAASRLPPPKPTGI